MQDRYQVAITGIGLITPVGNNKQDSWTNLINGKSGLSYQDRFDLGDYPYKVFGLVKGDQTLLDKVFPANLQRKTDRFIHLAMIAGHEAMEDSGLTCNEAVDKSRFGVCIGVGVGGIGSIYQSSIDFYTAGNNLNNLNFVSGAKKISPFLIPKVIINQAAAHLSIKWQLSGPIASLVNACSSSGDSVGHAFRMIRDGYADYMLTGGTESSIVPLSVAAFGNMHTLSSWKGNPEQACRPFDKDRSGFVMSEGAGVLVLERMDLAKKRGANIYAQIVGYASTSDAFHLTAMHPEGKGAIKAIEIALNDAMINKTDIGYINAHGTSTPMNDPIETKVLKDVFQEHVLVSNHKHAVVSSTKSMTGHLLGAAGGVEVSFSALALKNQILPPTINLDNPDPECDLDYVPHFARDYSFNFAISNSFGFGGGNSVVVLKKMV